MNNRFFRSFQLACSPGVHGLICVLMLAAVTWSLLSPDPFGMVRNTPLAWFRRLDDLILHSGTFAALSCACISCVMRFQQRVSWPFVAFLAAYSVATELIQSFVPGRTCDPVDALANFGGIALGFAVVRLVSLQRTVRFAASPRL